MIYFMIKEDATKNTHAKIIIDEIHEYSEKFSGVVFEPGEITLNVLEKIIECKIDKDKFKKKVNCREMRIISKAYLLKYKKSEVKKIV